MAVAMEIRGSHGDDHEFSMGYFTILPLARIYSVEWYDGR
jgi:hypothetical protein